MGGDEQVLRRPGRVAGGDGLLLKHIQSRAGETVVVQGVQKGGLVDGAAAAHVDHIGGLRQQGEARRGEKPLRLTGGGQGQGQDIRIRQEGVQLVVGMDLVKGGVGGLFGAADTADGGSTHGLGAAGKLRADITGADDGDGAAHNGAHGEHPAPAAGGLVGAVGRGVAQEHQRDHDHVLGDGDTVGAGGVGQHDLGRGIQAVVQISVHAGKAAAEPLEVHEVL